MPLHGSHYLSLSGTTGNFASTPDSVPLSITGDIDIRALAAPTVFPLSATDTLIGKYTSAAGSSYRLARNSSDRTVLQWSSDGTAITTASATATLVNWKPGSVKWIRATLQVNNGGVWTATFYTSADGTAWTQEGTAVNGAAVTSIADTATQVEVGSSNSGAVTPFPGQIYYAEIRSGIAGTVVASPDFRSLPPGTTSITDAQGNVYTVTGSALTRAPYISNLTAQV